MSDEQTLIPAPPVVRGRLAEHIREGRLLRSLLRLSIRAAEERHERENAGRCHANALQAPDFEGTIVGDVKKGEGSRPTSSSPHGSATGPLPTVRSPSSIL